jgi:hypothetical protein
MSDACSSKNQPSGILRASLFWMFLSGLSMLNPSTDAAASLKRYAEKTTGISFNYPTALVDRSAHGAEKPDAFTRAVFVDPSAPDIDVGSGYWPIVQLKVYPKSEYRREHFEDPDDQRPLGAESKKIVVAGAEAERIAFAVPAAEAARHVIELVEIPHSGRIILIDMRYGLAGCANVNVAFQPQCARDNKEIMKRASRTLDTMLSSMQFN